jgi:recA bacterial DNA recombination protein
MSSAVISTSAARGRPFLFDADAEPEAGVNTHAGTVSQAWLERSRRGCPVEHSSPEHRRDLLPCTRNIPQAKLPPASIVPASRLEIRSAPEMISSGIPAIDILTGGLPRGCLTEICGPVSSGRTTVLLAALAAATGRGEYCAVIDASDALDPNSLAATGVDLDRLLWVRCNEESPRRHRGPGKCESEKNAASAATAPRGIGGASQSACNFGGKGVKNESRRCERRLEQVLRATDLLLESGGFGLIILDLADVPPLAARHIPLTTWFRFRRAVEHKPTILLAIEQQPIAGSCSSLRLQLAVAKRRQDAAHGASRGFDIAQERALEEGKINCEGDCASIEPAHMHLLSGLEMHVESVRSRLDRKPARSVTFATKTAWAG